MSREIRRVPAGWQHPRDAKGDYIPLLDEDYETAAQEWADGFLRWESGAAPERATSDCRWYWDVNGFPPEPERHRPKWTEAERTWYQVYETVSEGTPTTPAFATPEELIEHLVANGAQGVWEEPWTRSDAEEFVRTGYRALMITVRGAVQ